jgi:hypothetical protein
MDACGNNQRSDTFGSQGADVARGDYSIRGYAAQDSLGGEPRILVPNAGFDKMQFDIRQSPHVMSKLSNTITP